MAEFDRAALEELTRTAPVGRPSTLLQDRAVLAGVTKVARAAPPHRPLLRSCTVPVERALRSPPLAAHSAAASSGIRRLRRRQEG
jgi:hypothetical protein